MQSNYLIRTVSTDTVEAVRFYYDVCPESPDGSRVLYFAFENGAPGPGRVMIANTDGTAARPLSGPGESQRPHGVTRHMWVDDDVAAIVPGGSEHMHTELVAPTGDVLKQMPGALRMVSPAARLGLTTLHDFQPLESRFDDAVCLMDLESGELTPLFTVRDVLARHPLGPDFQGADLCGFMHTKWSPDGRHFFVLCSNIHRVADGDSPVNALMVADADGANLRYVCEEYHHPIWGHDGTYAATFRKRTTPEGGGDRWWGAWQDFVANPLDGAASRVIIPGMLGKHATLSRDGSRVLVDAPNWPEVGRGAVLLYDVASRSYDTLVTLTQEDFKQTGCHLHPTFSRDETRVYFDAMEDGRRRVYAIDLTATC